MGSANYSRHVDLGKPLVEYGPVDIAPLLEQMAALPPDFWEIDRASRVKFAKDRPGTAVFFYNDSPAGVHRSTLAEVPSGTVNVLRYPHRPLFTEITDLIDRSIAPLFPACSPMRVQLADLPAGQTIEPHRDGALLTLIHRLHVPLITNPRVTFFVQRQGFRLEAGRLYDLNNAVGHSVRNEGDATRVHLLVDMLPHSVARPAYHDTEAAMLTATAAAAST